MQIVCTEIYKNPVLCAALAKSQRTVRNFASLSAKVARDFCKGGTKVSQQADGVLDTYGFRPRAVKEDWGRHLIKISLDRPTEGRDGRIRMGSYVIVCWSRKLLSRLQIPHFGGKNTCFVDKIVDNPGISCE